MEIVLLIILGLALGSFIDALVWRIYEQEFSKKKKLNKTKKDLSVLSGRSMCPNCEHKLAAKDLIPVFSWLSLGGKCRYCKKPIHWQCPVVELLTALLFVLSYIYWPENLSVFNPDFELFAFLYWLGVLTGLIALAVFDLKWMILPNRILFPLLYSAAVFRVVEALVSTKDFDPILNAILGATLLGGLFYLLFIVSKGRWIGGGDVKLGLLIGILFGPLTAYLVLLLASVIGSVVTLALMLTKKLNFKQPVPFGPYLILATYIAVVFGHGVIAWYESQFLSGIF